MATQIRIKVTARSVPLSEQTKSYGAVGELRASINTLKRKLGKPKFYDRVYSDGKVSTAWVFHIKETDTIVDIYDYKETSLYSKDLPSPAAWRRKHATKIHRWHVGSDNAEVAAAWLKSKGLRLIQ